MNSEDIYPSRVLVFDLNTYRMFETMLLLLLESTQESSFKGFTGF